MATLADLLRDIQTKHGASNEDKFYLEFGQFVCAFADVESSIHILFRRISTLKDERARAIIGGYNLGAVLAITKRLLPLSKISEKKKSELASLFAQLNDISKFRDDLVHRGAVVSESGIVSDNWATARTYESFEQMKFQLSHVESATSDLRRIYIRLSLLFAKKGQNKFSRDDMRHIFSPWRYKSVQRDNPLKRSAQKTPRLFPPRGSSRA